MPRSAPDVNRESRLATLVRAALLAAVAYGGAVATGKAAPDPAAARTASTHPMRYHVALPTGWSAKHDWPVLVLIPDAGRQFTANLETFAAARGDRPYILVAPEVLTCGGARTRTLDHYSYPPAVWDSLQGHDDFAFDDAGVAAVLADVVAEFATGLPALFVQRAAVFGAEARRETEAEAAPLEGVFWGCEWGVHVRVLLSTGSTMCASDTLTIYRKLSRCNV